MNCEKYIEENILVFDKDGKLKCRERVNLEYKEAFNIANASKYAKIMASFANNVGGYIIFGVKDKPREVVGVNAGFDNINQDKLTEILNSYFSPEIIWELGTFNSEIGRIGYIYVEESLEKPVMAIKGDGTISSGDIYYRYKARTEKIKYPEMMRLISERERRLQDNIIKVIETIRSGQTPNIGIINYGNGKISTPYGIDLAIDKKLILRVLKHAKYIKEGHFEEKGEPVLMVTGNIDLAEEVQVPEVEPDIQYPYLQKDLAEALGITTSQLYALVWHYRMKGDKKFHIGISPSRKGPKSHKFSEYALRFLRNEIEKNSADEQWLENIRKEHNDACKIGKGRNNGRGS